MVTNFVEQHHQVRPIALPILGYLIHEHRIVKDEALAGGVHVGQCIWDGSRSIKKIGIEAHMLENIDKQGMHVIFMAVRHWLKIFQKLRRYINMLIFKILLAWFIGQGSVGVIYARVSYCKK